MLDIFMVRYRSESVELRCLETLFKFTAGPYRLTIVDNLLLRKPLTLLWHQFITESDSEFIALINPDILFSPEWDDKCLITMKRNPRIAACSPSATGVCSPKQKIRTVPPVLISNEWLILQSQKLAKAHTQRFLPTFLVHGFVYIIRHSLYLQVGGFNYQTFPFYGQDLDFNLRANQKGLLTGVVMDSYVHHIGGESTRAAKRMEGLDPHKLQAIARRQLSRLYPRSSREF